MLNARMKSASTVGVVLVLQLAAARGDDWWDKSIVEGGASGFSTSLVVLPNGQPAISYHEEMEQSLQFATRIDGQWQISTVDIGDGAGGSSHMVVLPNGRPAIGYFYDHTLRYAERTDDGWSIESVDAAGPTGYDVDLAVLPTGEPAMTYSAYDGANRCIRYAWREKGEWNATEVAETARSLGETALVFLSDDTPAVCYQDRNYQLAFSRQSGSGWVTEVVDDADGSGRYNGMVVLPSGEPAIVYYAHTPTPQIKYAVRRSTGWESTTLIECTCGTLSMMLLPSGDPAFSFGLSGCGDLVYTWFDGSQWRFDSVDTAGSVGAESSVAVLPTGYPAISYQACTAVDLSYASFDGAEWRKSVVGRSGIVSGRVSIATLQDGGPAVAYFDARVGKYATVTADGWQHELIAGLDVETVSCSLGVLPDGEPALASTSKLSGGWTVAYTWRDLGQWHQTIIEPGVTYNGRVDLRMMPSGRPAVVYGPVIVDQDDPLPKLRFATGVDETWQVESIDDNGFGASLAVLPSGDPAVAYSGMSDRKNELRYAWRHSGTWEHVVVIADKKISSVSLAVLATGEPAIAYVTGSSDLMYALRENGTWNSDLVTHSYDMRRCELAILPGGEAFIAFEAGGMVRAARRGEHDWTVQDLDYVGVWGGSDIDVTVLSTGAPAIAVANRVHYALKYLARHAVAGDLNCDHVVDFNDIDPFVLSLTDPSGYAAAYPACNIMTGDIDGDGSVNSQDIDGFVCLLAYGR